MTDSSAPPVRRVKLKRVGSLALGDIIEPARGLFTRSAERLSTPALLPGPWEVDLLELDSSGMWVVELARAGMRTILWAPADAYVVLA